MKRLTWSLLAFLAIPLVAAKINMKDSRRAVGTDDGIRIDAELINESIDPHAPIGVMYRIENSTTHPIAVAEKSCEATYDHDSQTVTVSVGSEIPQGGVMPRIVVIKPGEKKTLSAGASLRQPGAPRFVQILVNVLRNADAFLTLHEKQKLDDAQFDHWIETNDAIELNAIPVTYSTRPTAAMRDASQRN